jgi:hypothetical protein
MRRIVSLSVLWIAACLLPVGCSKNASPPPAEGASAAPTTPQASPEGSRPPAVLPLPGEQMPPGHPPVQTGPLVWDVPAGWVEEQPASSMRRAQYRVPGSAGEGECVVYYFGAGQGGDPMANAVRWAGQFEQPDGSSSVDLMQVSRLEEARVPVQLVEVTGTYDGGMTMTDAPAEQMANYMLLGGIAQGADAPWFFKFTGPEATVRAQRESFVAMMESIRSGS